MGYAWDHEFHLSFAAKAVAGLIEVRQQRPLGATGREPVANESIDEALGLIRAVLVEHNNKLRAETHKKRSVLHIVESAKGAA